MIEHPALDQVLLGYSPMIDRHRTIMALRLTICPLRQTAPPDAGDLVAALAEAWPEGAGRLSIDVVGEALLERLLQIRLPANLMLEVPAFMVADPAHGPALVALYRQGTPLLVKGRPLTPLSKAVLDACAYSVIDLADERRDGLPPPGGVTRNVPHVLAGVRSIADMNAAFARGAIAVLGWPLDDVVPPPSAARSAVQPAMQTIIELINRVDRREPIDRLEALLKNDPTLAYKLLRYINAPGFGLRVEVTSFRHAIMLVGYQRLKRWLVLLLAAASRDTNLKPVVSAAVRRGLVMEELGRDNACDEDQRSELFICGVFSLLDRLMQRPIAELIQNLPTPDGVRAALLQGEGPLQPYLALVQAVEAAAIHDIPGAAEALMMAAPDVNRAVLRALVAARELD